MDPRQRNNSSRPAAQPQRQPAAIASYDEPTKQFSPQPQTPQKSGSNKYLLVAVALLLALGLALAAALVLSKQQGTTATGVNKDDYQAVFLVNDQVYFGKISSINDEQLVINDIYYLQQQTAQPNAQEDKNATQQNQQSNLSLAKLGDELHGPRDTMHINMDQVLFWENLKDEGQVAKAIENYKKD